MPRQILTPPDATGPGLAETLQSLYQDLLKKNALTQQMKQQQQESQIQAEREKRLQETSDFAQQMQLRQLLQGEAQRPVQDAMLPAAPGGGPPARPTIQLPGLSRGGQEILPAETMQRQLQSEVEAAQQRKVQAEREAAGFIPVTAEVQPQIPAAIRGLFPIGSNLPPGIPLQVLEGAQKAPAVPRAPETATFGGQVHQFDAATGGFKPLGASEGALNRETRKVAAAGAFDPEDLNQFPQSWTQVDESTPTREDYSLRGNNRAAAVNAASGAGLSLPSKKDKESALVAREAITQAKRIRAMLDAPADPQNPGRGKVGDYFGPASSRLGSLQRAGLLPGKLPNAVIEARQRIGKFSAKDRHELFGSALTNTESKFAIEFEPDVNSPASTLAAQLDGYVKALTEGLNSQWATDKPRSTSGGGGRRATSFVKE